MCSSTLSVNCEKAEKATQRYPDCRSPYFAAVAGLWSAPGYPRERGDSQEGGNRRCLPSCAPARRQRTPPLRFSEKLSARQGRTRLRQFEYPAQPVQKRSRPLGANTLTQFASPVSRCRKNRLRGSHSPRSPYAEKTKEAPLTRCLSLLWICRPLSSSSCRNYRSRRRYYHHRYRRNRSRRCPDRSIPRSG